MTMLPSTTLKVSMSPASALAGLVGNTPLLPLTRVGPTRDLPDSVRVFAKAEWFNPSGSIKDRPALQIIQTGLLEGTFRPGMRLLDSTSGNMGIAYATLGASMDIPVTTTIPANASPERISILRALGAELVLTDPLEGSDGSILIARNMAQENPDLYWYADQYDNPANWKAHYFGTGPEIWAQTEGRITHFVAGLGTSGTLTGVGSYLREANETIQVIAGQPDAAFHGLEGLKHMPTAIKPGIYDPSFADRVIEIPTEAARAVVLELAREEGLFVGISSGAAAWATFQVAAELDHGVVVTVFPDSGHKYLSESALWRGGLC